MKTNTEIVDELMSTSEPTVEDAMKQAQLEILDEVRRRYYQANGLGFILIVDQLKEELK